MMLVQYILVCIFFQICIPELSFSKKKPVYKGRPKDRCPLFTVDPLYRSVDYSSRDHIHYNTHSCPESYRKDNQVPVCPLCNQPVPLKKDELPDVVIGQHIDNECQSDPARKRRKIYTNKCSFKGCKTKELIPVKCDKCHQNFCLKHRHELDHSCKGFENSGRGMSQTGAAAIFRNTGSSSKAPAQNKPKSVSKPQNTTMAQIGSELNRQRQERMVQSRPGVSNQARSIQAGMSEDEALAQAIQMSLSETQQSSTQNTAPPKLSQQEEEDLLLAQAIAASQEEARREQRRRQEQQNRQQNKTSCEVS